MLLPQNDLLAVAGLYVHVPFRAAPRPYDDAYTVIDRAPDASALATAMAHEIDRYANSLLADKAIRTVYVGGARPSLCDPTTLRPLLDALGGVLQPSAIEEVTVELHPVDASPRRLSALRRWGVTRLSIEGLSFVADDLTTIGAAHSPDDLSRTIHESRCAGFDHLSVDLVFGGTHQSRASWKASLQRAVSLDIPHLTLHELEEGPADERADRLAFAYTFLRAKGYEPYELTHFARPGHRSSHQEHVYNHGSIVGIGPGAESFWRPDCPEAGTARRWSNVADLTTYVERLTRGESPVVRDETLDLPELTREYVLLRLRTEEGLNLTTLANRYDVSLDAQKTATLRRLRDEGLIQEDPTRVRLTDRGRLLADAITKRLLRDL